MEEHYESSIEKFRENWDIVESCLNENTKSGYKIAIIETEKIFKAAMDEKNAPGKDYEEKQNNIRAVFQNPEKLAYARAMYSKIIAEPAFDISQEDAKEIIKGYYGAISDISTMEYVEIGIAEKIKLLFEKYFHSFADFIKKFFIFSTLFLAVVLISTETEFGRSIAQSIVSLSRFIFYRVLPAIFAVLVFMAIIIGILYYVRNKRMKAGKKR